MAQNVYDNPEFFEGYSQYRRSQEGLAGAPEWQTLRSMLPPMEGLRVLDLGCGFGYFARWACKAGASNVVGIDLSEKMLERARILTLDPVVTYYRENLENLSLPNASFDLVYSSLALHYLEDFGAICSEVRKALTMGGYFVFSVEHPIYTAPSHPEWRVEADGSRFWILNNYLLEGERVTDWITQGIVKYHRPVSRYMNCLLEQGFQIARLEEWGPNAVQVAEYPEWEDELHRPPFLLVAAQVAPTV
ncbi:SAM-dependent methyltransferase [Armatimonadota bacterium]|nr:SAM-dependent methyltransferase [Armatimonadota bacterium]